MNGILRARAAATTKRGRARPVVDLVVEGLELSPVLMINSDGRADIADGFHRVSLVYRLDPYGEVPLKLA